MFIRSLLLFLNSHICPFSLPEQSMQLEVCAVCMYILFLPLAIFCGAYVLMVTLSHNDAIILLCCSDWF
jgi:hypothetical protein